jgi:hypothetical protein
MDAVQAANSGHPGRRWRDRVAVEMLSEMLSNGAAACQQGAVVVQGFGPAMEW